MSLEFNVCTYNMGSSERDYNTHCMYHNSAPKITSKGEEDEFIKKYNGVQEQTSALLKGKAQAYFFQEVGNKDRPIIVDLKKNNFEIVHFKQDDSAFDAVIALDKHRFKDIVNHSFQIEMTDNPGTKFANKFKKDVAIASATDQITGKRITFISAHAPGFNLLESDLDRFETGASPGDEYCRAIAEKLSEIGQGTIQVIGADMNVNPEIWSPRFDALTNQGFQILRTHEPTNVNPWDADYQAREIDFVFVNFPSTSLWQKIKSIFMSIFITRDMACKTAIGFDTDNNASDHLPIFVSPIVRDQKHVYEYMSLIR